jgi:hypothetical protein
MIEDDKQVPTLSSDSCHKTGKSPFSGLFICIRIVFRGKMVGRGPVIDTGRD